MKGASLGANCTIVCGVSIGEHAFVGAGGLVTQDVPPFILAAGSPLEYSGINSVGLKRRGFSVQDRNIRN